MLNVIGQHKFGMVRKFFASLTPRKQRFYGVLDLELCGQFIPMEEAVEVEFY